MGATRRIDGSEGERDAGRVTLVSAPRSLRHCAHPLLVLSVFALAAPRAVFAQAPRGDAPSLTRAATPSAPTVPTSDALADAERAAMGAPDSFADWLRLGWLRFRAGRFAAALVAYERARSLSQGDAEARAGVAWSLLRLGRRDEARRVFETVLLARPDDASAREGLALAKAARPLPPVWASTELALRNEPGHATRGDSLALGLRLASTLAGELLVGAAYRFWRVGLRAALPDGSSASAQHEGYLTVGWTGPSLDLLAHYAVLADRSGDLGTGHVFGLTARVPLRGELRLQVSGGLFQDGDVFQTTAAWSRALTAHLFVTPSLTVQRGGGDSLGSGALSLAWVDPRFSAFVGGSLGPAWRTAELRLDCASNLPDRSRGALWAGAGVALSPRVRFDAGYLLQSLSTPSATSLAHTFSFGFSLSSKP